MRSYEHKLFSQSGDGADLLIQDYQMADRKHAMVMELWRISNFCSVEEKFDAQSVY